MKQIIIALALLVSMPAQAEEPTGMFYRGGELLSFCENESVAYKGYCERYLMGLADAHTMFFAVGLFPQKAFCLPDGLSSVQLREVFTKYANENPQDLHSIASWVVLISFGEAFPCEE